ncbi:hypothetical protein KI387_017238, partial [Taxus chinensis]
SSSREGQGCPPFCRVCGVGNKELELAQGQKPKQQGQGSALHKDTTLKGFDTTHEEGFEGRGLLSPHDKFLSPNSHTHVGEKSGLHFEGNGAMKDEDLALTPIVVPESQHYEVINDHCLVNADDILACDESRLKRRMMNKKGKRKGRLKPISQIDMITVSLLVCL